jgi:hypothetical protein
VAKRQPKRKRDFTAETRSSQSSEYILIKKFFTRRPLRLRGEPFENLRMPRKLSRIAVHAFPQTALGKRGSPVGEQPQPKKIGTVHHEGHEGHEVRSLRERGHSCPRILAGSLDGAPSAPYTGRLIFGHYDKHVGVRFLLDIV